jgi:DNA-directed RNA polymerase subunit L
MPIKVAHIKVKELSFATDLKDKNNQNLQKCLSYIPGIDPLNLLPPPSQVVSFELHDTENHFANMIRRTLMNEITTFSLEMQYENMSSSDVYILCDFMKRQIELVPISQELPSDYDKWTISLEVKNKSADIIDVWSNNIQIKSGSKQINTADIINSNIVLTRLRPGTWINIQNMKIVSGRGRDDSGKFSLFANISYRPIDTIPKNEDNDTGTSSLVSKATKFALSYKTHRNIKQPLKMMHLCCDTLIARLDAINKEMRNIKGNTAYFSDFIELEIEGDMRHVLIKGEYWTLANIITRRCFDLTGGNIKFVSPSLLHPEKEMCRINIIHPEFSKLIQDACVSIIKDLEAVRKMF